LRLLLSVPAGGGGTASSVAGGQDPVLCRHRGGWYQVTVSLLPPLHSAGDWARMSFDLLCNATCVNSCRTAVMHIISQIQQKRIWFYLYNTPSISS